MMRMMMRQKDDMAAAFLNYEDAEAYIELQLCFLLHLIASV